MATRSAPFPIPIWHPAELVDDEYIYKMHFKTTVFFLSSNWLVATVETPFTEYTEITLHKLVSSNLLVQENIGKLKFEAGELNATIFSNQPFATTFTDGTFLKIKGPEVWGGGGAGLAITILGTQTWEEA